MQGKKIFDKKYYSSFPYRLLRGGIWIRKRMGLGRKSIEILIGIRMDIVIGTRIGGSLNGDWDRDLDRCLLWDWN